MFTIASSKHWKTWRGSSERSDVARSHTTEEGGGDEDEVIRSLILSRLSCCEFMLRFTAARVMSWMLRFLLRLRDPRPFLPEDDDEDDDP